MITPQLKDRVLKCLCENIQPESHVQIDVDVFLKTAEIEFDNLNSILRYFDRIGFIEELNCRRDALWLVLRVEAIDFFRRGGFYGQEELLENNLQKLLLEIDHLNKQLGPNNLETLNKLASISSAVISGIGLFNK
ncbi:hypothetical protein HUK80_02035 [Flavobacterium sp. MAH-1]|uniref:Uncharacterized protein n=1 Tax=Flavobacterium agri TaxID=2743471 RepID=A0A7Y8XZJ7_9FLAO|nr:hypothetical protein [Flavobacterium agri]NUY79660.1 hypothetical protein [Flavobacterium agri]NYA69685.1 hypothetical protein [Flavobacterium agri]